MKSRDVVDTVSKGNYFATIEIDDDPGESPREWDNLGTMVCWHRNYNLGDYISKGCQHDSRVGKGDNTFSACEPDDFMEWLKENRPNVAILLPLYLYDHSGISMSTSHTYPYNDRWDSGQVGFIFATKEQIRKEYSCKHISKKTLQTATEVLEGEVEVYDDYLTGNVFGYRLFKITNPEFDADSDDPEDFGDELDSLWGCYGLDYCKEEINRAIDWHIKDDKEKARTEEGKAWAQLWAAEDAMLADALDNCLTF